MRQGGRKVPIQDDFQPALMFFGGGGGRVPPASLRSPQNAASRLEAARTEGVASRAPSGPPLARLLARGELAISLGS